MHIDKFIANYNCSDSTRAFKNKTLLTTPIASEPINYYCIDVNLLDTNLKLKKPCKGDNWWHR